MPTVPFTTFVEAQIKLAAEKMYNSKSAKMDDMA
jgi:hypothetical protein